MDKPFYFYLIYAVAAAIVLMLIDGLVALIIRKMPERWFNYKKKIYNASNKEMKLLKVLGVPKWKDFVPELGGFTNFHKDKIADPFNNEYIDKFILEACYGYQIHIWSVPFSFLILLGDYQMYFQTSTIWLTILLPAAVINALLIYAPALILKYNLKRLIKIKQLNEKVRS